MKTMNPVRSEYAAVQIRFNLAHAMVGSIVNVMSRQKKVVHGVVKSVSDVHGNPRLVVQGARYDLDQVLTVVPASLA